MSTPVLMNKSCISLGERISSLALMFNPVTEGEMLPRSLSLISRIIEAKVVAITKSAIVDIKFLCGEFDPFGVSGTNGILDIVLGVSE